ncbi:transporter [Elysia marginata]|uniref:Transporter n=1 Tax=Elysia marginata TaxID=1093978 RepID=A0AAV4FLD7_9GAST|nr:transporter [Elysia marginata]
MFFSEDENKERGNWSGRLDFVLSMLGYAVGLGNIWRFPYLCYRNGGGAFLFPYLIMLFLVGIPLFYLEVSLGQFCSKGAAKCWDFAPMLKDCSYNWPLVNCENGTSFSNGTCYEGGERIGIWNRTVLENETDIKLISPSEEYWTNNVLKLSSGLDHMGDLRWHLSISLVVAWIVTFLCLLKGIKTTGKVVYFTALFPYVVLVILFFRGVTLGEVVAVVVVVVVVVVAVQQHCLNHH